MAGNLIGQVLLEQFRVDAFVAAGGMGSVYRVWDLKRSVPLAMKILHADLADDPAVFRRFRREANALKNLAHPNIVPFYGLHEVQDFHFLLEGYINGPTLKDVLRRNGGQALPVLEALAYLKAVCAALGYAHAKGVVHCDIKPANVMIDAGGSIYLTDFGIARHSDSTTTTMGGAGTPAYMAPEQVRGEAVSSATDIYALGVVLFELLTGQRPFRGETTSGGGKSRDGSTAAERIRAAHLTQPPPDPRRLNPALPVGLTAVLAQAMEKEARRRFPGTMALFNAACAAAGVNPASVPDRVTGVAEQTAPVQGAGAGSAGYGSAPSGVGVPTGTGGPPMGARRKQSALWVVGGAGLVLVVLIAALALRPRAQLTVAPTAGNALAAESEAQPVEDLQSGSGVPVEPSAAQPTVSPTPRPLPSDTPIPSPTPRRSTAATGGEWLAYAYDDELYGVTVHLYNMDLFMYNMVTGEMRTLTANREGNAMPSFSPDGHRLVFGYCPNKCKLRIMDLDTLAVSDLPTGDLFAYFPNWCSAPNSPWVAFEGRDVNKNANIWRVNVDTGEMDQLTRSNLDSSPKFSPDCRKVVFGREDSKYSELFIHDIVADHTDKLTDAPNALDLHPNWSPDGKWITFGRVSRDNDGDTRITNKDGPDLFIIRPDGSEERNLSGGRFYVFNPSWSLGSDQILFGSYLGEGIFDMSIYSLVTGQFSSLGMGIGPYYHPVWAP